MQSIAYLDPNESPETAESYDISQLLVCGYCREIRSPSGVGLETLSYVCPSCCCILGNIEARDQECRCNNCFACPKCTLPLRVIAQGANPSHVLSGPRTLEIIKAKAAPSGVEDGKRTFELMCTSCLWRSSEIYLVSKSIGGLIENAKELQAKSEPALQTIIAANLLLQSLQPKFAQSAKAPEPTESLMSAGLSQRRKAGEKRIVPANLQGLAFTTILQSPLCDVRNREALTAGHSALCTAIQSVIMKKFTHDDSHKDPSHTQEKLARLDHKTLEKRWNIRAFNTLLLAYTTQLLYSSLNVKMRSLYNAPHTFTEVELRRATTDSYVPKIIRAIDIKSGSAKIPKQGQMDTMTNCLREDVCEVSSYPSWVIAHSSLKTIPFPATADDTVLHRVRLIGRRSRRCLKCDRVLTRGYNERNAESAARSFIPRMLLVRSFTRKTLLDPLDQSVNESAFDFDFAKPASNLAFIESTRFPTASKKDELIVWCILNFQNLRNDEVLLRLFTDQDKSDAPSEEAVRFSDTRATLKTSSSVILELNFAFFDSKLRRVEMKSRQISAEEEPSERHLLDLINSSVSNAYLQSYIKEHMTEPEVLEFLGRIEENRAFIVTATDTMICAAIPLGIKENAKPGDIGKFILPGFVKTGERHTKFLSEITLCEIVN